MLLAPWTSARMYPSGKPFDQRSTWFQFPEPADQSLKSRACSLVCAEKTVAIVDPMHSRKAEEKNIAFVTLGYFTLRNCGVTDTPS